MEVAPKRRKSAEGMVLAGLALLASAFHGIHGDPTSTFMTSRICGTTNRRKLCYLHTPCSSVHHESKRVGYMAASKTPLTPSDQTMHDRTFLLVHMRSAQAAFDLSLAYDNSPSCAIALTLHQKDATSSRVAYCTCEYNKFPEGGPMVAELLSSATFMLSSAY